MDAILFWIDDWFASVTVEMMDEFEELGYFHLLLRAAKNDDCGLPDDDKQLAVLSGLGHQWFKPTRDRLRRIEGVTSGHKIREKFFNRGNRLYNDRLLEERDRQIRFQEQRRKAINARWDRKRDTTVLRPNNDRNTDGYTGEIHARVGLSLSDTTRTPDKETSSEEPMGIHISYKSDHEYLDYLREVEAVKPDLIEKDRIDGFWAWSALDYSQKALARDNFRARLQCGMYSASEPQFIHKPANFLRDGEYARPVVAPSRRSRKEDLWS